MKTITQTENYRACKHDVINNLTGLRAFAHKDIRTDRKLPLPVCKEIINLTENIQRMFLMVEGK